MTGYVGNLEELTKQNNDFRRVLYTGKHSQLVLMVLQPSEEIGLETHDSVDQFFRIEEGAVQIVMDGETSTLTAGMAAIVPAGTAHNVTNVSDSALAKFYTIYSPANHPDKVVHHTKSDALAHPEE